MKQKDIDKLLQGRAFVDARRAETQQTKAEIKEPLSDNLKALGFIAENPIDEFFDFNHAASLEEANRCFVKVGDCNICGDCCSGCQHYQVDGLCDIYEDDRPQRCKDYPTVSDYVLGLLPRCSHTFQASVQPLFDVRWR